MGEIVPPLSQAAARVQLPSDLRGANESACVPDPTVGTCPCTGDNGPTVPRSALYCGLWRLNGYRSRGWSAVFCPFPKILLSCRRTCCRPSWRQPHAGRVPAHCQSSELLMSPPHAMHLARGPWTANRGERKKNKSINNVARTSDLVTDLCTISHQHLGEYSL